MYKWFSSRTIFSMLLLNTMVSTCALVIVLVFSLQRVADEHPRRYLAKTLFSNLVSGKTPDQLTQISVDGVQMEIIPQDKMYSNVYRTYLPLLETALHDPDGVAMSTNDDQYVAAAYNEGNFIILPMIGHSLSSHAIKLLWWVAAAIIVILLANFYSIHLLTRPFIELRRGVMHANKGDLKYRIPLERTYGEYHSLADSFNKMLHHINHIHEARRHMLLAIPHELRTPLAHLKVRKDLITDEPLRLAILGDIVNVERILDAILYTEKTHVGEGNISLCSIDLVSFFNEVVAEQKNSNSIIKLIINTVNPVFYSHSTMMMVLMRNLISNAVFYGQSKPVTITIDDDKNGLRITVADQGIGIDKDQIPFLTEPFWRADQSRQRESGGYGLGLYICKTIVDGLHGNLVIDSVKGQGTSVVVSFPDAFTPPTSSIST